VPHVVAKQFARPLRESLRRLARPVVRKRVFGRRVMKANPLSLLG
jgi:hypothetical protein